MGCGNFRCGQIASEMVVHGGFDFDRGFRYSELGSVEIILDNVR